MLIAPLPEHSREFMNSQSSMEYQITNNQENQQFELLIDDHKAEMVYRLRDDKIYLMHTSVPKEMENRGIGKALVKFALHYSLKNNLDLVVYCPFVKAYVERHPNWKEEVGF